MAGMQAPVIGILEAGENMPELVGEHGTLAEWFVRFLGRASDNSFGFRTYRTHAGALPASVSECDAYLITGSPASVTEGAPWMRATQAFAREAADDRPVIGICFGHQLLADAFGGEVKEAAQGWGVGVHTYALHARKPWMQPGAEKISVLAVHMDQVVRPPPGAEVLAGSDFCPYGMLQISERVLTLQTHPESSKAFSAALLPSRRDRIGAARVDAALASLSQDLDHDMVGAWLTAFIRSTLPATGDGDGHD